MFFTVRNYLVKDTDDVPPFDFIPIPLGAIGVDKSFCVSDSDVRIPTATQCQLWICSRDRAGVKQDSCTRMWGDAYGKIVFV
jgi:hypothetical protein